VQHAEDIAAKEQKENQDRERDQQLAQDYEITS
jgi:hypothetical protein